MEENIFNLIIITGAKNSDYPEFNTLYFNMIKYLSITIYRFYHTDMLIKLCKSGLSQADNL